MATNPTPTADWTGPLMAYTFGRNCASMSHAYRLLEEGDPTAEQVFMALTREKANPSESNVWGTLAALTAGLNRDRIMVEVQV